MSEERGVHPCPQSLERFMRAEALVPEHRQVLRHLLSGCPSCRQSTGPLWAPEICAAPTPAEAPSEEEYETAISRVFSRVLMRDSELAGERDQAPQLLTELLRHPVGRQKMIVRNSRRFRSRGLCELLVATSHARSSEAPRSARQMAELAVVIGDALEAAEDDLSMLEDLRARAWGALGNGRRITSDLRGAEQAFRTAEIHLAAGTGDVLQRARLLDLKASLRIDQRRHDEALRLHDRVIAVYRRQGERHLLGRVLIKKAKVHAEAGHPELAVELVGQAMGLIDPSEEPRLGLVVRHNLIDHLSACGRHREAWSLLISARHLYLQFGDRPTLSRLRWLEGKIAAGLGRLTLAESAFQEARRGFVEEGIGYDAALVSLDLAAVYARSGDAARMRQLASEMLPIFQSRDVHREAIAALIVFQEAAQAELASLGLVREVASFLERNRHSSKQRFEPSSVCRPAGA